MVIFIPTLQLLFFRTIFFTWIIIGTNIQVNEQHKIKEDNGRVGSAEKLNYKVQNWVQVCA